MNSEGLPKRQKARTSPSLSEQIQQSVSQMWQRLVTASKPNPSLNPSTPANKKKRNVVALRQKLEAKREEIRQAEARHSSRAIRLVFSNKRNLVSNHSSKRSIPPRITRSSHKDCSKAATEARERGDYDEADKQADLAVKATQQAFAVSEQEATTHYQQQAEFHAKAWEQNLVQAMQAEPEIVKVMNGGEKTPLANELRKS
jgi:hypothetical protein